MKYTTPILIAASLLCASVSAQQQFLSEDFDTFPPTGWTTSDNGIGGWTDGSAFTSQLYIIPEMAWHDEYVGQADSYLVSPSFDLSGAGSTVWLHWTEMLKFQTRMSINPSSTGNGNCEAEVSLNGGSTWTNIWTTARTTGNMKVIHVDLSSLSGQASVQLRWRYTGDNAHHWGIDEVRVDGSPYGIVRSEINPANGFEYVAYFGGDLNWGRSIAAAIGVDRVSVQDAAENQWLWQEFSKWNSATSSSSRFIQRQVQLGGTDEVVEGIWEWEDGTPWGSYVNWGSGQPNNSTSNSPNGEDYLYLNSGNGTWKDGWEGGGGLVVFRLEGPQLSFSGSCPGTGTVAISGVTPNGPIFLARSFVATSYTLTTSACAGTVLGIDAPVLLMSGTADANGDWSATASAPANACGLVHVQGIDYAACAPTNVLSL